VREQFDKLAAGSGILNLHRMMAHAPALMKALGDMVLAFRRETKLPRAVAELAILRAAQVLAFVDGQVLRRRVRARRRPARRSRHRAETNDRRYQPSSRQS
jgi:hypothetical protein